MVASIGTSAAITTTTPIRLHRSCKDPALRSECQRIGQTALRDADNLVALIVGTHLEDRFDATGSGPRDRAQTVHAIFWAVTNGSANVEQAIDAGDAGAIERANRNLEFRLERGDIAFARETLRRLGVSEAEAAEKYLEAYPERSAFEARLLGGARGSAGTTK